MDSPAAATADAIVALPFNISTLLLFASLHLPTTELALLVCWRALLAVLVLLSPTSSCHPPASAISQHPSSIFHHPAASLSPHTLVLWSLQVHQVTPRYLDCAASHRLKNQLSLPIAILIPIPVLLLSPLLAHLLLSVIRRICPCVVCTPGPFSACHRLSCSISALLGLSADL